MPRPRWHTRDAGKGFNPRPAVRPGDAHAGRERGDVDAGFNPRPAVRPGDASSGWFSSCCNSGFNPRPAVRPGDACCPFGSVLPAQVSIRARP